MSHIHYGLKSTIKKLVPNWAWDGLRHTIRLHRFRKELRQYPARVVAHQYCGVLLRVWLADRTAEQWYDRDWDKTLNDLEFLQRSRLSRGAKVFDLGAHQGVVALILANLVGPEGLLVAVEANSHNAEIAVKNRELNGAPQIQVINAAIGDRSGTILVDEADLNGKVGGTAQPGKIEMKALTIDDLTATYGRPDVVYLDIEGFECHALRGARATLAHRPDLMIEVHHGCGLEEFGESVESLLELIPADGYELFFAPPTKELDPGTFRPFSRGDRLPDTRFFMAAIGAQNAHR